MKDIRITKDEEKTINIVLIITSVLTLLLGLSFFFDKYIEFLDGCEIFYIVMLLYFGLEFTNYLLTKKYTGMHHLYISLACIISSASGLKYMNEPSNYVVGLTLIGWIIIMIIIKLIKIEELRNKLDSRVFINIFTMSLFILLGFLVSTNIILNITNECLILGFFFTANGIFNLVEVISNLKLKKNLTVK